MVAKLPLLRFDDNSYPDELIIKFQGMGKWCPFKSRTTVPISHIKSVRITESKSNHDAHLVKVKEARRMSRASLSTHNKKNQDGKVLTITINEKSRKQLCLQVNDYESEKVLKVLREMCNED